MATRTVKPTKPHFFKPLLPGFRHQLVVPGSFYVKYMEDKKAEKAVLRTPMGKLWHVKLKGRVIEDEGWEEFCEEEGLEVGFFLVFGLVEAADVVVGLVFDVLVFDLTTCLRDCCFIKEETQLQVPHESAGHLKNKKQDISFAAQAGASVPQNPYFVWKLSSYSAKSATFYVPMRFARENGLCNKCCDIVLMNEQGKQWLAGLGFKRNDGQVHIHRSWSAFRCANSIKAGDSVLFQLIRNGKKPVLKITRCPEGLKLKPKPKPKPKTKKQPINNAARARDGSWSTKPQVYVTVKPSYIKHYGLMIPANFAKKCGIRRKFPEQMTIRNERGQSWKVTPRRNKVGAIYLGVGWTAFARSNGIKERDVLKLELVKKGSKPVMKISGKKNNLKSIPETQEDVKAIVKL